MQEFLADLHIHSRFSRATSSKLNIPLLAAWARVKGIAVLGTGDFTHPKWREELNTFLRFDEESGLYRLADPDSPGGLLPELPVELLAGKAAPGNEKRQEGDTGPPVSPPHFMLQGEISSIYKRGGKVRKVHNLVYVPTLEAAESLSRRLAELGNLNSDGRPILGLDSRDLLEMVLETDPQAFLIPAHIWTPWFSVFGSKSGFDSLEDCFGDLTSEIFALETGLSSDPAMNRMWSVLDPYRLVSNSDAHSGENLGREANVFSGKISYAGMLQALKTPDSDAGTRFHGTLEFYPEEGKYHMDGHRKCGVRLTPEETRDLGGLCPVCGSPLTVGVLYRVLELADREQPEYQKSDAASETLGEKGFASLVPLPEVLGEILGFGSKTRKVRDMYAGILERFGPELAVLRTVPEKDLARFFPPLGEAIGRMRRGEVQLQGGFDGEYGVVRMFTDKERREVIRGAGTGSGKKSGAAARGLSLLGDMPEAENKARPKNRGESERTGGDSPSGAKSLPDKDNGESAENAEPPKPARQKVSETLRGPDKKASASSPTAESLPGKEESSSPPTENAGPGTPLGRLNPSARPDNVSPRQGLNPSQEAAVTAGPGPTLVLAGPGTGKTRTLVARILRLLEEGVGARRVAALTFTRRAATEMDARLSAALGPDAALPRTDTLHALALGLWHKTHTDVPVLLSEESARRVFAEANSETSAQLLREAWQAVNLARERLETPSPEFEEMRRRYAAQKGAWNLADYTDLLEFWLEQTSGGLYRCPWDHVLVDEVQDLSPLQLAVIRSLLSSSGEGFFGIGDPHQSIYGFRGAHGQCLEFFQESWPNLAVIRLTHNYRSRPGIVAMTHAALGEKSGETPLVAARSGQAAIFLFEAPSAEAEAVWVADRIAGLIGSGSHSLMDAASPGRYSEIEAYGEDYSPGDIAVLVRNHVLGGIYRKALARKGVPVAMPALDAFWADERVSLILRAAGRMLGIAVVGDEERRDDHLPVCPDKVLARGPLGVAAYLTSIPPFDDLFWQSQAFRSLVKAFGANGGDWAGLLTWIHLQNDLELVRQKGEKVQIISLHAAKGLEFRSVFMPCLEDGLLPFAGPELLTGKGVEKKQTHDLDEEHRLFYVGLSRARDALFLSFAGKRLLYGRELRLKPSRFLAMLPQERISRSALVARTTRREEPLGLL